MASLADFHAEIARLIGDGLHLRSGPRSGTKLHFPNPVEITSIEPNDETIHIIGSERLPPNGKATGVGFDFIFKYVWIEKVAELMLCNGEQHTAKQRDLLSLMPHISALQSWPRSVQHQRSLCVIEIDSINVLPTAGLVMLGHETGKHKGVCVELEWSRASIFRIAGCLFEQEDNTL